VHACSTIALLSNSIYRSSGDLEREGRKEKRKGRSEVIQILAMRPLRPLRPLRRGFW
jgi:hypothetical protein